jgi:hypothetical protein
MVAWRFLVFMGCEPIHYERAERPTKSLRRWTSAPLSVNTSCSFYWIVHYMWFMMFEHWCPMQSIGWWWSIHGGFTSVPRYKVLFAGLNSVCIQLVHTPVQNVLEVRIGTLSNTWPSLTQWNASFTHDGVTPFVCKIEAVCQIYSLSWLGGQHFYKTEVVCQCFVLLIVEWPACTVDSLNVTIVL